MKTRKYEGEQHAKHGNGDGAGPFDERGGDGDPARLPAIIDVSVLPGRLSLGQLAINGFITLLDPTCGYVTAQARTLTGRAQIVTAMIPPQTTACMRLAQWVWIGGQFPDVIELATFSHFRADMHGRPTHTYKRIMDEAHRARIGKLTLTSPIRTACDIGCLDLDAAQPAHRRRQLTDLRRLMVAWNVSAQDCAHMLRGNRRWPGQRRGLAVFEAMRELEGDVGRNGGVGEDDATGKGGSAERKNTTGRNGDGISQDRSGSIKTDASTDAS